MSSHLTFNLSRALRFVPAVLVVGSLVPVDAGAAGRNQRQAGVFPVRSVDLQPHEAADVIVSEFRATLMSDGSVTISGRGSAPVGEATSGFDFVVDLEHGTYTTQRLDPAEIAAREPHSPDSRSAVNPAIPDASAAISPGDWWGRVRVQTKDPVLIVLAQTTTELAWRIYTNGTVAWLWYSDGCWAANPSSLGTHWFVSYCGYGGPWYGSSSYVCNANSGSYYNWDFGSNTQRTDSWHSAQMCGRNDAWFDYWWSYNDSGEFSLLIFGSVVLN